MPLLLSMLSACALIPDLGVRPAPLEATHLAAERSLASSASAWPAADWWQGLEDAQLSALIEQGLKQSPGLAEADARLKQAQAQAEQVQSTLGPNLAANAGAGYLKQSYNNGIPSEFVPKGYRDTGRLALDFGYDLDFWGRNRATFAAALSETEAQRAEQAQARLELSTAIAAAYADLGRLSAERRMAQQARNLRAQTAKLIAQRQAAGLENRAAARQQDAALAGADVDLGALDEQIELTRHRLATLLGAGPDAALDVPPPAPRAPRGFGLPETLQADLMGRRPDLTAARLRAEAAAKRVDVAEADFYPNVNLNAFLGVQSLGLNNLTRAGSDIGQAALAVSLPIFDGGALRGAYRQAGAEYETAVALYNQTLVHALQEVADAATSRRALEGQLRDALAAQGAAEEAEQLMRRRYEGGLSSFLMVLEAQDRLVARQRVVVDLQARAFVLDVTLIKALGGGYTAPAA